MKKITLMLCVFLSTLIGFAQTETLAEWTPATVTAADGFGESPFTASTTADNLVIGGVTRGSGIGTTGTPAANAWGGNGFTATSAIESIDENEFVTFTITADAGYTFSIEGIEPYNIRRSAAGPTTGQWQYQIGSGTFTDIGSEIIWGTTTTNAGNNQSAIDLSDISELQNIASGTVVTFRILLWDASGTGGTWYLNGHNNATYPTLTILGTVEEESSSVQFCDATVSLTFPWYGDVTEWRVIDGSGTTVVSGGPYDWNEDFTITETFFMINPPYSLEITIDDWMEYCDNFVDYSVTVGGVQDIEGTVEVVCDDIITETFVIGDCPDCSPPAALQSVIGEDFAVVMWASAGDLYDVEYGTSGFTQGTGTTVNGVAENGYIIEGLSIGAYDFYVRQDCGAGEASNWTGPYSFVVGGYTAGNIPTQENEDATVTSTDFCTPEPALTVEVPEGMQIASLQVQYKMTAHNGAWMEEQLSFIYSPTLGLGETELTSGIGDDEGTLSYNRSMSFANGATGNVDFVLRAWRTWSDENEGCNTDYNYVNNGTWVIIPTFEAFVDPCADVLAPTGNVAQEVELNATIADLDVTGTDLTWYSDATLTTEVAETLVFGQVGTFTYYVTQTIGDCTSDALAITVTVTDPCDGTLAPNGDATQEVELNATIADLDVTGTDLTWYSDATLTTEVAETLVFDQVGEFTYWVTQTIGDCTSDALAITITVLDPCPNLVVPVFEPVNPICQGDFIEVLPAASLDGITGTWSPALNNMETTTYEFTPDLGQCASIVTMTIVVNEIPDSPIADSPQTINAGQTLADIIVDGDDLTWYSDPMHATLVDESFEFTEGSYTFWVTQTVGDCTSEATEIEIEVTLSTNRFDETSFRAYPNPVKEFFHISYSKEITNISVINMLGQTVIAKALNSADTQMDMTSLPKGAYFVKVIVEGNTKTVKVIKQ